MLGLAKYPQGSIEFPFFGERGIDRGK